LVVDDEEPNRMLLSAMLESLGYACEEAADGFEALALLRLEVDLVLLDVMMPGMDGFQVARRIREEAGAHDLPIVMVTALTSREDRLAAVEAGANDFIAKPVDLTELRVRVASLLRLKAAQDELRHYRRELEQQVERRTAALREALEEVVEAQRGTYAAQLETIQRLAFVAEFKDENTAQHIRRMSQYAAVLARKLSLSPTEVETIQHASPMHDVGKIFVPSEILLKPGSLTAEEYELMKQHTLVGGKILVGSHSRLLQAAEEIALTHHERWDGTGYPAGLAGEGIPLPGRICAIADVFDALTSSRPYKPLSPPRLRARCCWRAGPGISIRTWSTCSSTRSMRLSRSNSSMYPQALAA
jgi:putative two-component system response regulator